jgi:3-phenylpropionate/trans-cinnamate dioxygenase ferredoxin component
MGDWITVEGEAALAEGVTLEVDMDGISVLLARQNGCVFAMENRCTHDGSELNGGHLEDGVLVCPHHGAKFSLKDGEALCAPAYEPLTLFETRVENGVIQLRDQRW